MRTSRIRRVRCAALLLAALAALALAQTLGLLHRVVHADVAAAGPALAGSPSASASDAGADWLHALFGGHQQGGDCESYDKLTRGDGFASAHAPVLAPFAPPARACVHRAWHAAAAQAAGFLARGPPRPG